MATVPYSVTVTSRAVSMRWEQAVLDRLQRRARVAGWSASALAQRYVDEGLRMAEHPGIVFQDGPAGRRPAWSPVPTSGKS